MGGMTCVHMTGVLQGAVGEQQLGAHRTHIGFLGQRNHYLDEVGGDDLDVVVEQQQQVAGCVDPAKVHLVGEVEWPVEPHQAQAVTGHAFECRQDVGGGFAVNDHHELDVCVVRKGAHHRAHRLHHIAALHAPHPARASPGGNDHTDQRLTGNAPTQPVGAEQFLGLHDGVDAHPVAVFLHRPATGLVGIGLGSGVRRHRHGNLAPVVEHLGKMVHPTGLLGDAQDDVVVL